MIRAASLAVLLGACSATTTSEPIGDPEPKPTTSTPGPKSTSHTPTPSASCQASCAGCCDGDTCLPGDALAACGVHGAACGDCASAALNADGPSCTAGACDYTSCAAGFADKDGDRANGCEAPRRIIFQCDDYDGGLCVMNRDGSDRRQLHPLGFKPDMRANGDVVYHDASYRVHVLSHSGDDAPLADGAMARWLDAGDILFQCSGLGGGICRMHADGTGRQTLAASGRVPVRDAQQTIWYHTDAYRIVSTAGADLGRGAHIDESGFDGFVAQCHEFDGGICRLHANGQRVTVHAEGFVPAENEAGDLLFHVVRKDPKTNGTQWRVQLKTNAGDVTDLGPGAHARWIP